MRVSDSFVYGYVGSNNYRNANYGVEDKSQLICEQVALVIQILH